MTKESPLQLCLIVHLVASCRSLIAHAGKPAIHFSSVSIGVGKTESPAPSRNHHDIAYVPFGDPGADVWRRLIIASIVALIIQWATSGALILMAYLTPTTGLECRSGSYLLYGVVGTLVWVSMVSSMLFSHAVMVHYESNNTRGKGSSLRQPPCNGGNSAVYREDHRSHQRKLAVVSTLFELIEFYDNFWCHRVQLTRGLDGYVSCSERLRRGRADWRSIFSFAMASHKR